MSSATTHPTTSRSGSYITVSETASLLGLSQASVRQLDGQIASYRSIGGHRRFLRSDVLRFAGHDIEETCCDKSIACYIRVSSEQQNQKGSLQRQRARLLEHVVNKEGIKEQDIAIYSDVGSAFSGRKQLNSLCLDMVQGKLSKVYVEYQDRLARDSCLHLVEFLASAFNVQLIYLDKVECDESETVANMKELLAYCTVLSNRSNAQRSAKVVSKKISSETIRRILDLRKQGLMITRITATIQKEGHIARTVDGSESLVSHHIVRKVLSKHSLLETAQGETPTNDYFEEWKTECLVNTKGTRTTNKELFSHYQTWLKERGIPESENLYKFGRLLAQFAKTKRGFQKTIVFDYSIKGTQASTLDISGNETFQDFCSKHIVKSDNRSDKVNAKEIYATYVTWCKTHRLQAENKKTIGMQLTALFGQHDLWDNGKRAWRGYRLV